MNQANLMNFDQCRINMVECQLSPNGIKNKDIIELFSSVPRERFYFDEASKLSCYKDEDTKLNDNKWAVDPVTEARIIQYTDFKPSDVVLIIGASTPTLAAYISPYVATVIVIDEDENLLEKIRQECLGLDLCNITCEHIDDYTRGYPKLAPYDKIVFSGTISKLEDHITAQVVEGGEITSIIRENYDAPGVLYVSKVLSHKNLSKKFIYNANTPYLPKFGPETSSFSF